MSRRRVTIVTAVTLVALLVGAALAVRAVLSNRSIDGDLVTGQVSSVASHLIGGRNEVLLVRPDPDDAVTPYDELMDGERVGGVTLSPGAIAAENQAARALAAQRPDLFATDGLFATVESDIEVDAMTVDESTAVAFVTETTTFTPGLPVPPDAPDDAEPEADPDAEPIEQEVERVLSFSRDGDTDYWVLQSMKTTRGTPLNGI